MRMSAALLIAGWFSATGVAYASRETVTPPRLVVASSP